jgi:tRNA A-37 threonylcarbamoyl transferase component Bud32
VGRAPGRRRVRRSAGFRRLSGPGWVLCVDADFEAPVRRLGLEEDGALARLLREAGAARGRDRTAVARLAGRAERIHLRPLRHGGWLGPVLGARFPGLARPARELERTARLRAAGAPVPRPLFWVGRRAGLFWEIALATVHEEESVDAGRFLASSPAPERLSAAAQATGRALRRLHDAGGRHRDLHVGNLLLREAGGSWEAIVVDLDRVRVHVPVALGRRATELARLHRSLVKRGLAEVVGARGCSAFLEAYADGDPGLRSALAAALRRRRPLIALHALAWRRR